jgi:hypothetical protein
MLNLPFALLIALSCRTKDEVEDTGILLLDRDGDGYDSSVDCDDDAPGVHPDAIEVCNGVDDNCNDLVDDAAGGLWYTDADLDGFGDPATESQSCEGTEGTVGDATDCDDTDANVNVTADELCNGFDDDCDGDIDVDAVDATLWYDDADEDGWGAPATEVFACEGTVAIGEDCDDADAAIHPDAEEICDGLDNDCDGRTDPKDSVDALTWYADADADGFGTSTTSKACEQPEGWSSVDGDCDDTNPDTWPEAAETCDDEDNDCDSSIDEGVLTTWYLDADGDGFGDDDSLAEGCDAPTSAYVDEGGDCDDTDSAFNPDATEGCDGSDYNCDGDVDNDADGDDYADQSCGGDDCDDADSTKYPDTNGLCALGTTCNDVLTTYSTSADGDYVIDPDGLATGLDPFEVTCDMTTDGGGWTEISYADDLDFKQHHSGGDGYTYLTDDFEFNLTDDQITAIQDLSTEGNQTYEGLCNHVIHYYYTYGSSYAYAFGFMFHDGSETVTAASSYSPHSITVSQDNCAGNGGEGGDPADATLFEIDSVDVPVLNVNCRDCGDSGEMFGSTLTSYPAYLR